MEKKRCLSGYFPSLCNSDTEGSADEEGTCAMMRSSGKLRKQPAIKLPFTMDEITSMPRSNLHEVLTRNPNLSQEQICAIHEIRRRGKNRIAAQRCRKRKMECIRSLVAEIEVLRSEHANLMSERRQARDQAQKLSDKFKSKCEKFFKCEKKCKMKLSGNCHASSNPSNAAPAEGVNLLDQDEVSVRSFQQHAERAAELCRRLKEVPCDDLPACTSIANTDCTMWTNPCMSPPECEVVVCDSGGGDSSDAGSILQAASPASSFNESVCAMSPSQRLSDFGNIYISQPGHPSDTKCVTASGTSRTSVVLHTSSVENKGQCAKAVPALDSLTQTFVTYPTHCIPTTRLPQAPVPPHPSSCPLMSDKMNVDSDQPQK